MKRFLVVRSGFFERHGWVMKEATIFSWEDAPTRTKAGVVHGNEVQVYGVTMIHDSCLSNGNHDSCPSKTTLAGVHGSTNGGIG
jgi:hypothetical protein